jgi:resorcinol 4-hydroxylase (FADH2)
MNVAAHAFESITDQPFGNRPSVGDLKLRLASVTSHIKARAHTTEKSGRVPAENMLCLREIGYFDIVKPRAFGGYEYDFDVLVDLNIELAKTCASTAWSADCSPPTNGGYTLTGRWSFASGCDNAQWSLCAALLPSRMAADRFRPAFLLVPALDFRIDDTWNVVGLSGTGSKTLQLKDVFVPEHRVLSFLETTTGLTPGALLRPENPGFSIPMLCNIPSCLASVAVGTAAGALEDYLEATERAHIYASANSGVAASTVRLAEPRAA